MRLKPWVEIGIVAGMAALALACFSLVLLGGADQDLAAGLRAYEQLDFRRARAALERALDDPRLEGERRCTALAHLARVLAILDEPQAARRRFVELLDCDPAHTVSWKETPRIRDAFAAAVASRAPPAALEPPVPAPPPSLPPAPPPRRAAPPPAVVAPAVAGPVSPSAREEQTTRLWWWAGAAAGVLLVGGVAIWAAQQDAPPDPRPAATWALP